MLDADEVGFRTELIDFELVGEEQPLRPDRDHVRFLFDGADVEGVDRAEFVLFDLLRRLCEHLFDDVGELLVGQGDSPAPLVPADVVKGCCEDVGAPVADAVFGPFEALHGEGDVLADRFSDQGLSRIVGEHRAS